jgi:hypothetical protein
LLVSQLCLQHEADLTSLVEHEDVPGISETARRFACAGQLSCVLEAISRALELGELQPAELERLGRAIAEVELAQLDPIDVRGEADDPSLRRKREHEAATVMLDEKSHGWDCGS